MTVGVLNKDWVDPINNTSVEQIDATVESADNKLGFIDTDFSPDFPCGEIILPEELSGKSLKGSMQ